ncbi:probable L-type lectin-domain containing receptor kinase S.5 [Durio zibethinus]|uniref:non-specific serine/threonine protein kinase n=1 Tax=Durio zibethinus TaxID=66656 RepID=A0A6P6AMC7_DURZI|nr:probable L-type lectin-domain containing receptor kinase S.5 [Durio zibethinus]
MFCHPKFMPFFQAPKLLVQAIVICSSLIQVQCLNFSYPSFSGADANEFVSLSSLIINDVIEVSPLITDASGRVLYKEQLKLWDKLRGTKSSFISTFVINIRPQTSPGGEGLAFILTDNPALPNDSGRQWLGIVNASTINVNNIVAVEFDTRKSDSEDVDDNHVGVDVKNIYSIKQEPLAGHGVNLSSGEDITARIQYDAKSDKMTVFVMLTRTGQLNIGNPIFTVELDLSENLPEDVFVGFSGSTGEHTQVNSLKSWNFTSFEVRVKSRVNLLWLWILIPIIVIILIGGFSYFLFRRRKNRIKQKDDDELEIQQEIQRSSSAPQKFRLKELIAATGNFNVKNKLGSGGFGTVYKGILRKEEVAVKRIQKNTRRGKQDFIAEVTTISNLHHKNLVKLFGWCYESNELLLVYEFMPNGSLDRFIYRNTIPNNLYKTLNWVTRHNIICGVAKALDYLHNGCDKRVIHRDIKSSNIMLDSDFNARLGDFGLARTIQLNEKTHYSTKGIAGTPGYMAPESFHTGKATVETDIYAFGVLILEVVSGRKPGHQNEQNSYNSSIVEWVWEQHRLEKLGDVIDLQLNKDFDADQAQCILLLGLACCHPNPYERPSMRTALQVLTGEVAPPSVPAEKPAFIWPAMVPTIGEEMDNSITGGQLTTTTELSGR